MNRLRQAVLTLVLLLLAASTARAVPGEVTNLQWCAGPKNCLQWNSVAGATQYKVYRGERASLPCILNLSLDSCDHGFFLTTTTGATVPENPAPASFFWFVTTARDGMGEGTPGLATAGPRRVNDSGACLLSCAPAGAACTIDNDCCSSNCLAGTCRSECCAPTGGFCFTHSDCCSNVCSGGQCQPPCTPTGPEVCNNLDDDCNGFVDDGLGTTTCGTGACQRTVQNCANGVPQSCVPGNSSPEVCNNIDDNCDGLVDEGLGSTTCGFGTCERTVPNCVNGLPQNCVPGTPVGGSCSANADCCSNVCTGNVCQCAPNGNSCVAGSDCCSNFCQGGFCTTLVCNPGFADCNNDPSDGCEINTTSNPQNCGACGAVCSIPNATAACVNAACTLGSCLPNYADCNANLADGCEVNTSLSPNHCGQCGTTCSSNNIPNPTCAGGTCDGACASGFADCNNNKQTDGCETNTTNSPQNCGACGVVCSAPNATSACVSGSCAIASCNTGFGNCNGSPVDGCETNLNASPTHCGGCGVVCSSNNVPAPTCQSGTCNGACATGFADCNGNRQVDGCEVNTNTNTSHCGACGNACVIGAICSSGQCFIP